MSQSDNKDDRNDDEQQKLPAGEKHAKPQLGDLSAQLFGSADVNVDENIVQSVISENKTLLSGLSEQYKRTVGPDEASASSGSASAQSAQGVSVAPAGAGGAPAGANAPQGGQVGTAANPPVSPGSPPPSGLPRVSSISPQALPPPPPGSPRASSTSLAALPPPAWASGPKTTPPPPPPKPVATAPSAHAAPQATSDPAKPAPVPIRPAVASAPTTPPTTPSKADSDPSTSPFAAQPAGSSDWDSLFARAESALAGFSKPDASDSTAVSPRDSSTPPPPQPVSPSESSTSLSALPVPTPTQSPPPQPAAPPPVKLSLPPVAPSPAAEVARTHIEADRVPKPDVASTHSSLDTPEPGGAGVPSQENSLSVDILSADIDEVTGQTIESATREPTDDEAPKFDSTPRAPSQSSNYVDYRLLQEIKEEQEEEEDDSDLVYEPLIKPEVKEKKDEKKVEVIEEPNEMRGMVRRVKRSAAQKNVKPLSTDNKVLKILEKNPLGMTLPEMAGGTRKQSRIKFLRPMLAQAIKEGLVMPVSQRAGHTVYKLVKNITH